MNEQFFVAECDEAMYPIAERLGKLAARMLPDTRYMHKFERLWRDVGKYSDVLDHVKGRVGKDPTQWTTEFYRVIEREVLPLLNDTARRAGYDPQTIQGHQWVMSRFRKFGDMLFTEYNFSLAIR